MASEAPITILIAEDNKRDTFLLRHAYARTHRPYHLRFVSTGLEVVDYLEGNAPYENRETFPLPEVLLVDLTMPQGGGFNVLSWLQASPHFRGLPAIVFTASKSEEDRKRAMELGAKGYYLKSEYAGDASRIFEEISSSWLGGGT